MNIITFLLFLFALLISFYLPGLALIQFLRIKMPPGKKHFLAWIMGMVSFLLISYLLAYLQLPQLTFVFLICCFLFLVVTNFHTISSFLLSLRGSASWRRRGNLIASLFQNKTIITLILAGSLSFVSLTYFSGYQFKDGIHFMGVNTVDGVVHLAYIKSQAQFFPPVHPALAEVPLRGYHYFYDFLLSRFALFYGFTAEDLYFRLFPLFIAILYGASIYFFAQEITKDKVQLRIILFLSYFSQATLSVMLLFHQDLAYLGISPPMYLIFDPSIIVGITLLLSSLLLLPTIGTSWALALLTGIVLGTIAQIKVYTGIVGICALVLYIIYRALRKEQNLGKYLFTLGITGIVTYLTFGITNVGSGSLVFAPLLLYREFLQRPLFADLHWEVRRSIFAAHQNIPRLFLIYLEAVALVWFLNLGSKLIILLKFRTLFRKRFWQDHCSFLLLVTISISILIPSFFIQSRSVFDVVQFFWIALVLLGIPAGIIWGELWQKNRLFKGITVGVLGLFSVIGFWYIEQMYFFSNDPLIVLPHEFQLYEYITQTVPTDVPLIYLPKIDKEQQLVFHRKPLIAAMTGRSVYMESEVTPYVPEKIITERKKILTKLSQAIEMCDEATILSLMNRIGSEYLIMDGRNECLHAHLRGVKIESSSLSFYVLETK